MDTLDPQPTPHLLDFDLLVQDDLGGDVHSRAMEPRMVRLGVKASF
jgi:hypothetical protein